MVRMSLAKHADVAVNAGKSDKTSPLSCGCTKVEQLLLGPKRLEQRGGIFFFCVLRVIEYTIMGKNDHYRIEEYIDVYSIG